MTEFDLVVRNGTVVTAADTMRADIGVRDGRIVALGAKLGAGRRDIDATGRLVLPGGVDAHVHVDQRPTMGAQCADDFFTGSRSAACGGTTTIIPFAAQHRGQSLREVVKDYHRRAAGNAVVDYAFHLIVTDPTEQVLGQELPALIRDGYTSFKIFMTYEALRLTDRQILEVLALARREGALVMVHAENFDCIQYLTERLLLAGKTETGYHGFARPGPVEREATHRAISLAELVDAPVLIVHVSSAEAMEQIRWAQGRGLKVFAETCPQYLFLSQEDMEKPGFEGAKCMCSPPPRGKENQQAIWHGLRQGVFQIFSSDHAPYRFDAPNGKLVHGPNPPFSKIANGVPGVETRLPLLFSEGVGKGRLDLNQFVALTSTNAAKLYGLYPRKGTIAVGADADLAIWDPKIEVEITNSKLHHNVDYTPYEGMRVTGWPAITLVRGEVVAEYHDLKGARGHGRFYSCDSPGSAVPLGRLVTGFDAAGAPPPARAPF